MIFFSFQICIWYDNIGYMMEMISDNSRLYPFDNLQILFFATFYIFIYTITISLFIKLT